MGENTVTKIMELKSMSLDELQKKYEEVFDGAKAPSNNKVYVWRKIAYRMQELEYGGIPVETQGKIEQRPKSFNPRNFPMRLNAVSQIHVDQYLIWDIGLNG